MPVIDPCEICGTDSETLPSGDSDTYHLRCDQCGEVVFTGTAASMLRTRRGEEARRRIQGYIRDQNRAGAVPTISSSTLDAIISRPLPPVSERADRLLLEALHGHNRIGISVRFSDPRFIAASYSLDREEIIFLLDLLSERDLLRVVDAGHLDARVLPGGYVYADELTREPNAQSDTGFIAMWFDQSLDKVHTDGFQKGIIEAGYDPLRVDQVEHVGRIDDEIIAAINSSRFVVADFTGHRGGVYFEAGYAMGMELPVFWTCRKDDIGELHFDIRQYNCIDWESPEDLAVRLTNRISAVLGKGPHEV